MRLDDLVAHAARLVPMFAGPQVRYKVSVLPDKRTIRYYVQEGLIDRPGRRGREAVFFYRHLLQVLVIKRLQADYLPLKKIAEITRSDDGGLEKLLTSEAPAGGRASEALLPRPRAQARLPLIPAPGPGWNTCRTFRVNDYLELRVDEGFDLLDPSVDLDIINARIVNALSILALGTPRETAYDAATPAAFGHGDSPWFVPAPPVASLEQAVVALITEGGLVPKGNPDGLESSRATRFLKYSLAGIGDLRSDVFESIDLGWDTADVNADPDRLVPLDVMRELEAKRVIGRVHGYFYTTTGVATTVEAARAIGRGMAAELRREGVSVAILTAT